MFLLNLHNRKLRLPSREDALKGRENPIPTAADHFVSGAPLHGPFGENLRQAMFGFGCFWGAERKFWELDGVFTTAVGYAGGYTANPTYQEVCSGMTGHNEVVFVVYDPAQITYEALLKTFWEAHDPTQGMRQGNDVGTQYRSAIYVYDDAQRQAAEESRQAYQDALREGGVSQPITTEIAEAPQFYYAEEYHQQYLAKNPNGYCGLGGTGVACPIGLAAAG
jgi:peptide-methionine (S)-S-oxide reductase